MVLDNTDIRDTMDIRDSMDMVDIQGMYDTLGNIPDKMDNTADAVLVLENLDNHLMNKMVAFLLLHFFSKFLIHI
ncbi:hypothetical protein AZF06_17540 [Priestia endophytica]|nr:hypothetical protein AZF06_17540 [Priestia endophytica]MBG9813938.1 hypothetical protein [Priestia endophytica]